LHKDAMLPVSYPDQDEKKMIIPPNSQTWLCAASGLDKKCG
jgi:hypothetical protein